MDITRNVCVREVFSEAAAASILPPETAFNNSSHHNQTVDVDGLAPKDSVHVSGVGVAATNNNEITNLGVSKHRNSLPNVALPNLLNATSGVDNDVDNQKQFTSTEIDPQNHITTNTVLHSISKQQSNDLEIDNGVAQQDVGCISGRLEIRVIPNGKLCILSN